MEKQVKENLGFIHQTFSEHLSAINENTSEIQTLFDYLCELDLKIEKISQRIDKIQFTEDPAKNQLKISPLTHTEKKIFLTLYTEEVPLNYIEISQKSGVPLSIVGEYLTALSQKGIPFVRSFSNNQTFIRLDPRFKEIQAKENLINLSLQSFMNPE